MGSVILDFLETTDGDLDDITRTCYCAVLQYFQRQPTDVAVLGDLVAFLQGQDQLDADEARIAIHLHHVVLPKLADAGYIDYDARTNTARYRGHPQEIR